MLQSMESPRVNTTKQLNSTELEHKSIHQDDIVIGSYYIEKDYIENISLKY